MSQPGKRRRKVGPGTPANLVLTRTDWLWISSILLEMVLVFFGWTAFELNLNHELNLTRMLSRWRGEYHLTEEQERQIRAEEERFHGSANPLTRPRRTPEEAEMHTLAVGHLMNPVDGARFLARHKPVGGSSTNWARGTTADSPTDLHP